MNLNNNITIEELDLLKLININNNIKKFNIIITIINIPANFKYYNIIILYKILLIIMCRSKFIIINLNKYKSLLNNER